MTEDQNRTFTEKFALRMPDGMRDRIKASAGLNGRSMNAEIVAILDDSLPPAYRTEHLIKLIKLFENFENEEDRELAVSSLGGLLKELGVSAHFNEESGMMYFG